MLRDLLKSKVRILEKRGAESLRNHDGRRSEPGAVGLRESSERKTDSSEMVKRGVVQVRLLGEFRRGGAGKGVEEYLVGNLSVETEE